MKKYHLADCFTLLEGILAIVLFVMAIRGAAVQTALWTFVAGELCDAIDGPCARRWHYPDDGKYRWWRHYNSELDQATDIMLAISCGFYLIWRVNFVVSVVLIGVVSVFCAVVQFCVFQYDPEKRAFVCWNDPLADRLILLRRHIYVVAGIGGAIGLMVWSTNWSSLVKQLTTLFGLVCGFALLFLKWNRWCQNKTPL